MGLVEEWKKEEKPCIEKQKQSVDMIGNHCCHTKREGYFRQ